MGENKIKRTTWRTNRSWDLQGMAQALYQWLSDQVPGEDNEASGYRGWELAGTLNPEDPDPTKYKPPPKWLDPEKMMQGACAWQAGAIQDFMFDTGLLPLVRARIDQEGGVIGQTGADVDVTVEYDEDEGRYLLTVKQDGELYDFPDTATMFVTPHGDVPKRVSVSRGGKGKWYYEFWYDGTSKTSGAHVMLFR